MKKRKINRVAFLLLLLAVIPVITAISFIAGSLIAKHIVIEKMETGLAKTFVVPLNRVQWIKEGKELTINGKLFDAKTYSVRKDSLELTGIFDTDEDLLVEQYKKMIQDKNESGSPGISLLKIFFQPVITADVISFMPNRYTTGKLLYPLFSETVINIPSAVTGPPPRLLRSV